MFVTQATQLVPENEALKHSRRDAKGLSSLWIFSSYFFSMWDITRTGAGERERGKKAICVILCSSKKADFFFFFASLFRSN